MFKNILASHNDLVKEVHCAPADFFTRSGSKKYTRVSKVCKRLKLDENLILLGAGDGLEKLTFEEYKYVQPFFLVVRAWLKEQPYLLHSQQQMVDYICSYLIIPLMHLGHFVCQVSLPRLQLCLFQFSRPASRWNN